MQSHAVTLARTAPRDRNGTGESYGQAPIFCAAAALSAFSVKMREVDAALPGLQEKLRDGRSSFRPGLIRSLASSRSGILAPPGKAVSREPTRQPGDSPPITPDSNSTQGQCDTAKPVTDQVTPRQESQLPMGRQREERAATNTPYKANSEAQPKKSACMVTRTKSIPQTA